MNIHLKKVKLLLMPSILRIGKPNDVSNSLFRYHLSILIKPYKNLIRKIELMEIRSHIEGGILVSSTTGFEKIEG